MTKIRTALYLRLSHPEGIKRGSASIPAQFKNLREEAEQAGETVVGTFTDEGISGRSTKGRSDYARLLDMVRSGRVDKVRIESVARGHRNDPERRAFEAELNKYRVILQYRGEQEKMPPAYRKFKRNLDSALAEMESDTIAGRVYSRKKYLVGQRKWQGGAAHYGLRADGKGWLEHDPETYPFLLWILEQRADGVGYGKITEKLNQGISLDGGPPERPLPPYTRLWQQKPFKYEQDPETGDVYEVEKLPPSGKWGVMTIRNICRQAVDGIYTGVWKWGKTWVNFGEDDIGEPKAAMNVDFGTPFVPQALIERVRSVETDRQKNRRRWSKYNTYLVKPRCGLCGGSMAGTSTHPKMAEDGTVTSARRYRCIGRATNKGSCVMRDVDADYVEQYVIDQINERFTTGTPGELAEEVRKTAAEAQERLERALSTADRMSEDAERRKAQATDALERMTGRISERLEQEYIQRAEDCLRELDTLSDARKEAEAGIIRLADSLSALERDVFGPLQRLTHWADASHREEVRRLLSMLVLSVVVHPALPRKVIPERIDVEIAGAEDLLG